MKTVITLPNGRGTRVLEIKPKREQVGLINYHVFQSGVELAVFARSLFHRRWTLRDMAWDRVEVPSYGGHKRIVVARSKSAFAECLAEAYFSIPQGGTLRVKQQKLAAQKRACERACKRQAKRAKLEQHCGRLLNSVKELRHLLGHLPSETVRALGGMPVIARADKLIAKLS